MMKFLLGILLLLLAWVAFWVVGLYIVAKRARNRRWKCPACGNVGREGFREEEDAAFETRGIKSGLIKMCRGCGAGLRYTMTRGLVFGKPRIIPNDEWLGMRVQWDARMAEHDARIAEHDEGPSVTVRPPKSVQRFILAHWSLQEFLYAYVRLHEVTGDDPEDNPPAKRVFMNALYHYTSAYFLAKGDHKLSTYLTDMGLDEYVTRVEAVLARPMGSTTMRNILYHYRCKVLAHPSFTMDEIEDLVYANFDLREEQNWRTYIGALEEIWDATAELAVRVGEIHAEITAGVEE